MALLKVENASANGGAPAVICMEGEILSLANQARGEIVLKAGQIRYLTLRGFEVGAAPGDALTIQCLLNGVAVGTPAVIVAPAPLAIAAVPATVVPVANIDQDRFTFRVNASGSGVWRFCAAVYHQPTFP